MFVSDTLAMPATSDKSFDGNCRLMRCPRISYLHTGGTDDTPCLVYSDGPDTKAYCRVKQRTYPMLGFKKFTRAAVTIGGIELAQKIRKGVSSTSQL